jgi:hypothetical protein
VDSFIEDISSSTFCFSEFALSEDDIALFDCQPTLDYGWFIFDYRSFVLNLFGPFEVPIDSHE